MDLSVLENVVNTNPDNEDLIMFYLDLRQYLRKKSIDELREEFAKLRVIDDITEELTKQEMEPIDIVAALGTAFYGYIAHHGYSLNDLAESTQEHLGDEYHVI